MPKFPNVFVVYFPAWNKFHNPHANAVQISDMPKYYKTRKEAYQILANVQWAMQEARSDIADGGVVYGMSKYIVANGDDVPEVLELTITPVEK